MPIPKLKPVLRCNDEGGALRAALREWYTTPVGRVMLDAVQDEIDRLLPRLFGYHAVQVGDPAPERDLLDASRIIHRLRMDETGVRDGLRADPAALPFAADCVDLLVLVHALEFCRDPHEVLREAERVLVAEGHLVLVGFNPYSLFGLWRLALGWRGRMPWCGRFYPPWRVRDWMALLGFDVLSCTRVGHRPPFRWPASLRRLSIGQGQLYLLPGGIYVMLARKRVATLTPIRPRWRPRRLVAGGLAGPSMRKSSRD
ncbi:MAG: methyltransferase domain-containing protein [Chromatiales bacterium]|jgi:SAM-dependent methyltransferase|nr:methyltransferase domain-containing protein [Chromatiales bacterium]MDX9766332.1 methyltransferase domain-containing protein [Ectothiorhodospiraceae bacterium]